MNKTKNKVVYIVFQGMGEVVSVGDGVSLTPGQSVMYYMNGAFCDYMVDIHWNLTNYNTIVKNI